MLCSPIDEPRTIILFVEGSYEHFLTIRFEVATKFKLFTSCAPYPLNGSTTWQSGNLDSIVDLVQLNLGNFFKFEHDNCIYGLNVLSIYTFQIVPRAMKILEPYLVHLNLIGSLATTKK